ncbi:dihydrodipicolinate synthase family protein [Alloacidobacterium dinghuense]|uniref:Dihydrodipicolinate synthase family protein n=1 Tax=Alloacidobacterium dinghuense TaxID=2763107 RepID=A0A7G8BLW4_9BACT|nr:dihydrodipicolinate synthase family protein [Alloacidobacterium dinghuense]QNI33534.1 dihydrodipicolinate synthase family protein [Alloacidobacterium dinghuense]
MNWFGVMPAMTTAFDEKLNIDHVFMAKHATWMIENGCTGLVMLGSLGEAATLTPDEKVSILKNIVATVKGVPVVAAISALSTAEAVSLAKTAADNGCSGLMVLPPYVYRGDWRETKAHIATIFRATPLSCMLYNNPVAYGTDFLPEQIAELSAEHANFHAVKESSTDVRRVSAIRALLNDRLKIFVGVDDAIVEGIAAGATGWIAGLVNAMPAESVALFNFAYEGKHKEALELYRWFLPLLRMDTVPKFIQLIKFVQQEVGVGSARVRAPRLEITGDELTETKQVLTEALKSRPMIEEAVFAGASR